jgi:hypothetical protein
MACIHDQSTTAVDNKIAEVARSFASDDLEGTAALLMAPLLSAIYSYTVHVTADS